MKGTRKKISALLFAVYLFLLLKVTLFRTSITLFNVTYSEHNGYVTSLQTAYDRANFIPFYSVYYYLISRQEPLDVGLVNIFGNILLFIPFGLLLPLAWSRMRSLKSVVLVIAATSLFFEVMQMVLAIGNFDIDDVLLNILGGMLGYALFTLGAQLRTVKGRRKRSAA